MFCAILSTPALKSVNAFEFRVLVDYFVGHHTSLFFFFARLSSFIKRVFVSILGDIFVVSSYHIMKDLALLLVLDILLYVY